MRCKTCQKRCAVPGQCEACGAWDLARCPFCGLPARMRGLDDFFPDEPVPELEPHLEEVLNAYRALPADERGVLVYSEARLFLAAEVPEADHELWLGLFAVISAERSRAHDDQLAELEERRRRP